jgi:hypothetical protein
MTEKKDIKEVTCKICGRCCHMEISLTLLDIRRRRISDHLGVTWGGFFKTYIATEPSVHSGGLKLKREAHCTFFRPTRHLL